MTSKNTDRRGFFCACVGAFGVAAGVKPEVPGRGHTIGMGSLDSLTTISHKVRAGDTVWVRVGPEGQPLGYTLEKK